MDSLFERLRVQLAPTYHLERELGRGGMGEVFLAREVSLDRPVAIKTIRPDQVSAAALARFRREAELQARVRHPNVVAIHAVLDGPILCAVLDHVEGQSLQERLLHGPLPLRETLLLGQDLLAGVAAIHRAGLLHRDLKPANILLAAGRACITDFGVAAEQAGSERNSAAGTAGYQAPEQLTRQDVGQRTDLHGVGAVLYEALTGRRWSWQAGRKPDWHGVPGGLARILGRALDPRIERRWRDADAFARALRRYGVWRRWRSVGAAGVTLILAVLAFISWTPPPRLLADLTIKPLHGCNAGDSLATMTGRYVGYELSSFSRWSIALDGKGPARFALQGDRECAPTSRLVVVITDSSERLFHEFRLDSAGTDPVEWSRQIADSVVAKLWPRYLADFRATRGTVPAAVRAYFEGEDAFHRDDWLDAVTFYREAYRRDPQMAYARWRMIVALMWAREPYEEELAALTGSSAGVLPETQRRLAHALTIQSLPERVAELRAITDAAPDDADPAFLYANELFARGPLVGIPLDSAMAWFQRARERSPHVRNAPALTHEAWGAMRLGKRADASRAVDARKALGRGQGSGGIDIVMFLRLGYHERFNPAIGRMLQLAAFWNASRGDLAEVAKVHRLGLTFDLPETELDLAELILEGSEGPPSPSVLVGAALGLFATGRPVAGLARLDSAMLGSGSLEDSLQALEWRVLPGALGYPGIPGPVRDSARHALEARALSGTAASRVFLDLGLDAYAAGDSTGVRHWLGRARPAGNADSVIIRQVRFLEALDLAVRGEYQAALAHSAPLAAEYRTRRLGGPFVRAALHVVRAHWHLALADSAAALADLTWYQNSDLNAWPGGEPQAGEVDAVLGLVARVERAGLLRALGQDEPACRDLARARQLLVHAEPEFRAFRDGISPLARGCG